MKTTSILATTLAAFLPAASAWQIVLLGSDGRQGVVHGTFSTSCITLNYSPNLNVVQTLWQDSAMVGAYQVWETVGCTGRTQGKLYANRNFSPAFPVRSYKLTNY